MRGLAAVMAALLLACGGPEYVPADAAHSDVAGRGESLTPESVVKYGMTPISGKWIRDGTWEIRVRSSSDFFRVEKAELTVKDGKMTAALTMATYSYELLYPGTAEEAAAAPAEDYVEYEDIDDYYVFTIPVDALNEAIDCAAFSTKKKKWYDRKILFDASTLDPEALNGIELPDYDLIADAVNAYEKQNASEKSGTDGEGTLSASAGDSGTASSSISAGDGNTASSSGSGSAGTDVLTEPMQVDMKDGKYSIDVDIAGGSGRATVSSPTLMIVKDGKAYAQLLWSSTYYDWMKIGEVTYKNETTDGGNSSFTIPISSMDSIIPVVADTTAMGDPVAIDYSLTFYAESVGDEGLIPQEAAKKVVLAAAIIIVAGFFLNLYVKKRKKNR